MGRKRDRFWDYAEDLKGRFKCNYCKHEFPGGASRIKSHLAGVKGRDIVICDVVPEDVQKEAYKATQETNKKHKNASTSSNDKEGTVASTSISTIQKENFVTQRNEEYMAEIVLNDVVDRLVTKAFSLATENIIFKWGFKEELKNLLDTLYKIKVVLHQKRQVSDESVGIWLMKLRNVAYEVDNVLDEFDYEIIWQKVQLQNQMIDQVRSFSFCSHDKVKTIKQSLDELVNDIAGFGLRTELLKSIIKIRLDKNEDSFLNDSEVVGREFDVLKILNELISSCNQQVISVLPIVGMAGLGKTTLAKVLYSHEEIKKHFDALAWVHVSENFDVEKISREIRKSLKIESTSLGRRKYFLVLDDIWIEDCDKWDILRSHLEDIIHSNDRINIIVTTCSKEIAQIVKTLPPYHLEKLSKDDCWSILKKRAFADEGKSLTFDLEASGREIARRCGGVPLVARVVGGTMCFKCDKSEWLAIEKDKNWYLLDDNNNDIFSMLKLCFDHLPAPSLKQCFAYCAIFPKDYDIKNDEIIQYWMAEGFLDEPAKEANMVMEDIGNMYFNILLATSFFQNARKDKYGNIISCKMHDFSLSISKSETLILESDSMDNISNVQNLFVQFDDEIEQGTSFRGECFIKLHTSISKKFDFEDILSNFKVLRVLKLSGDVNRDSITELSDSIEHLIHLRLLHISHTDIRELPKSITKLYHLQTLRIEANVEELPENLSNLINLRHIHIFNCTNDYILEAPKNVGRLTCLQMLPLFGVGSEDGYRITELGALKNLKGEIVIENLENVKDEEEAKSAKLKEKEIFKLELHWTSGREGDDMYDKDEKVLEGLQPHPNMKSLTIQFYLGKKFPSWVGLSSLYHNLIEINLRYCWECEEVPTLGQLPCLRVLNLIGMGKVRCIGSEFYFYSDGSYRNTTPLFPALRILKLVELYELEEWKDAKELTTADEVLFVFPCLEELTLFACEKLRDLPNSLHTCASLKKLVVGSCNELWYLPGVPSIIRCGIEDPPSGLQYLENGDCRLPSTSSIHPSLQKLKLSVWNESLLLLDQIQYFIALKILWIEGFHEIGALPEWLGNLSSLQKLYIVDCKNLVHLPTEEAMRRLTQLKTLEIYRCPNLEDNARSKIDHIPFVNIKDSWKLARCLRLIYLMTTDAKALQGPAKIRILRLTCEAQKMFVSGK
ncbi:hypothetical protein RGQ29_002323 [Quercus rubra]|uniref:BED-type domain-containing protein n=1 Tax=Quercus rubra TaxID=3512 RepID=A0AAN7E8Q9_QUERU|nr:hypothetical protein RGQ29_002323 [Quercus rubra]